MASDPQKQADSDISTLISEIRGLRAELKRHQAATVAGNLSHMPYVPAPAGLPYNPAPYLPGADPYLSHTGYYKPTYPSYNPAYTPHTWYPRPHPVYCAEGLSHRPLGGIGGLEGIVRDGISGGGLEGVVGGLRYSDYGYYQPRYVASPPPYSPGPMPYTPSPAYLGHGSYDVRTGWCNGEPIFRTTYDSGFSIERTRDRSGNELVISRDPSYR